MNLRQIVIGLVAAIALVGVSERAAYADFCVRNDGAIVIAFQSVFNFAFGAYAHPVETSVFTFPTSGAPTYDTTYHGNGTPSASSGTLTIIACPITASEPAAGAVDPNAAK